MKRTIPAAFLLVIFACRPDVKKEELSLTPSDTAAVAAMGEQRNQLLQITSQLAVAGTPQQRHHLDSTYHHHDSLYWHHHHRYNDANNHPHNDHHHQWVPYNPAIDHSHHYHYPHPGRPHDSLVVVSNNHHPDHNTHHPTIHSLHDHHVMDSLHHLHQRHH